MHRASRKTALEIQFRLRKRTDSRGRAEYRNPGDEPLVLFYHVTLLLFQLRDFPLEYFIPKRLPYVEKQGCGKDEYA
ncbi:MAG: hypothetical protein ACLFPO_04845 [Spirochaetaceae bacterium]